MILREVIINNTLKVTEGRLGQRLPLISGLRTVHPPHVWTSCYVFDILVFSYSITVCSLQMGSCSSVCKGIKPTHREKQSQRGQGSVWQGLRSWFWLPMKIISSSALATVRTSVLVHFQETFPFLTVLLELGFWAVVEIFQLIPYWVNLKYDKF